MTQSIIAIARNTYRESIRSKALYSLFFFAVVLLGLSFFFGRVTIGDEAVVKSRRGTISGRASASPHRRL